MVNPISPTAGTALPPMSFPVVDQVTGGMSLPWYQCLLSFWTRTGGAVGANVSDLAVGVQNALDASQTADNAAAAAHLLATDANAAATIAETVSSGAQTAAGNAEIAIANLNATVLLKTNNLTDVASLNNTRRTLGILQYPLTFHIVGTPTLGQSYYTPIIQSLL
jgi:hypothetical protein